MKPVLPALLALCIFPSAAMGQSASRTTHAGVYSREQAVRGQQVFLTACKNCHTPESHTSDAFVAKWNGKPLSELYQYIRDQMPKNEPGSLAAAEYADVLAYVLRLNRIPAGDADLPTEVNAVKSIRLDIKPTAVRKEP